jgi:hypothetical protein
VQLLFEAPLGEGPERHEKVDAEKRDEQCNHTGNCSIIAPKRG